MNKNVHSLIISNHSKMKPPRSPLTREWIEKLYLHTMALSNNEMKAAQLQAKKNAEGKKPSLKDDKYKMFQH